MVVHYMGSINRIINLIINIMFEVELKKLKKGDFFKLTPTESSPVWIRDDYYRSEKKFECYKFDDINHFNLFKGTKKVYIDFIF